MEGGREIRFCRQHSAGETPACPGTRRYPRGLARGGGSTAQNLPGVLSTTTGLPLPTQGHGENSEFIIEPSFGKAFVAEIWYFKVWRGGILSGTSLHAVMHKQGCW